MPFYTLGKTMRLISSVIFLVALFVVHAEQVSATLIDGLIVNYTFTGNADNNVAGNANNGVISGANLTTDVLGNPDSAFLFNGTNAFIEVNSPEGLNIGDQSWTISSRIKTTVNTGIQSIVSRYECGFDPECGAGDEALYSMSVQNGLASFEIRSDNSTRFGISNTLSIADDTWHHISAVLDQNVNTLSIYIDGVLSDSISTDGLSTITDSGSPLEIGRTFRQGWGVPSDYFDGSIDDIRIYNRALSSSEITQISNPLLGDETDFHITSITVCPTNMVGTTNMALGKNLTPHTNVVRGDPQNVVDGDFGTLWYSYQGGISTIYFTLDIGREVIIGRYVYRLSQTSTYLIETSNDGVEWTNRYSGIMSSPPPSSAIFTNDVFGAHTARYFRYTGGNSVNAYVGINEFQVFETKSPHIAISFPSQSNRYYTLQGNNDLSSLNWTNVVEQVGVPGNGDTISLEDTNLYSSQFYRVQESDMP